MSTTAGCNNPGTSNPNGVNDTTAFIPQYQRWYNAICVYHRGAIQVYINGTLIASRTGSGTLANLCPGATVNVGGWWVNDKETLNGVVDEVRLYNRTLRPNEIAYLSRNFQANSTKYTSSPSVR